MPSASSTLAGAIIAPYVTEETVGTSPEIVAEKAVATSPEVVAE